MKRLLLWVSCVALVFGQDAVFTGRVLSREGAPLKGAKVTLVRTSSEAFTRSDRLESVAVTTDDAGRFRHTVGAGDYDVTASAEGYSSLYPPLLRIAAGQTVTREMTLERAPVISGRVVGPDGEPVRAPSVVLYRANFFRGQRELQFAGGKSTSDERGEFRLTGFTPGRYYVGARTQDSQTTLYPDALTMANALAVTAVAGTETAGIVIKLRQEPLHTMRGRAIDAAGDPVAGIVVSAQSRELVPSASRLFTTSSNDGRFEIGGLLSGSYYLFTLPAPSAQRAELPKLDGRLEVYIGKDDVNDIEFRVRPRPEVTGRVRLEDGSPVPNTQPLELGMFDLMGSPVEGGARPAPDGSFTVQGLAASRYSFGLNGLPTGHYIKSIRFAGQELLGQAIDFTSGASGQLDIVVSNKASTVTGAVVNDKAETQPGLPVFYWRGDGQAVQVRTDQNGAFRLDSLPPGDYRFAAFEAVDFAVMQNPQFRNAFNIRSERIELKESEGKRVELKVIPRNEAEREASKYP